jgi:hypothetical protein
MTLRLGALEDALLAAGIDRDKAIAAAEEVASYEQRVASVEARLGTLAWMTRTVLGVTLATAASQVAIWIKLTALGDQFARLVH